MVRRKRYTGLIDRVAWVGRTLVPMHRQLMEAQLRCFPLQAEYKALDKAIDGVTACAAELLGDASPLKPLEGHVTRSDPPPR